MKKLLAFLILALFISINTLVAEEAGAPSPETQPSETPAAVETQTVPAEMEKPAPKAPKPPQVEVKSIEGNYLTRSVDRFGHGVGNIALSPLEIFYRTGREFERTHPIAAVTAGSIKGVTWFAMRAVAGAIEVATFFIPMDPLIRDIDTGWFNA